MTSPRSRPRGGAEIPTAPEDVTEPILNDARDALAAGEWERAREAFSRAADAGVRAEAFEGLAQACGMLVDGDGSIAARERAHTLYRERGDRRSAARMAILLALDSLDFRYEAAVAGGWMHRADRLLAGGAPSVELGMLRTLQGHLSLIADNDLVTARRRAAEARELARLTASPELEVLSLGLEGLTRVSEGSVREGMRLLDEATVAALSGDVKDLMAVGQSCCYLIHACERVRDYARAGEWCLKVREFCERWRYATMFTVCRTQYASVLMHRGDWSAAEAELLPALDELRATRPAAIAPAVVRLAELRRRQGRRDEARSLFESVRTHRMAVLGRGELALDEGDARTACDLAEQALRHVPEALRSERVSGLDLLARAAGALGDDERAGAAAEELDGIARVIDTDPLRAFALRARGLALTRREPAAARRALEDAADIFERVAMPFEAAHAHLALARALAGGERDDAARVASRRAAEIFARLGAASTSTSPLTARERDVLRLVADGLADKEIAARLELSPHTVHRHVANILTKLDLPSRAAAVARAARLGLID